MNNKSPITPTPWDMETFGVPTWEINKNSEELIIQAKETPGHYTIKVDPLADKRILHENDFYYCDTLIEPYCNKDRLRTSRNPDATIQKITDSKKALEICRGAFSHGRFHRDFNLSKSAADLRYDKWLINLIETGKVWGLYWQNDLAGFIACQRNSLILHAISKNYRGKGFAKYWWSAACEAILEDGHLEITSSISATNLAILNLYSSLGFSFRSPVDIYHRLTT